jgi:hypothetical protein
MRLGGRCWRGALAAVAAVTVLGVVAVGLAAAIGGASVAKGDNSASPQPAAQSAATTAWPVNELGQTYGSDAKAKSETDVPDLVAAVATNGRQGYCLNSEMNLPPEPPKTAEEAEAMMRDALCKGKVIPVYESDGVTQIGVFQIGGPGTTMIMGKADGTTITKTGRPDGTVVTTTTLPDGTVTTTE